MLTDANTRQATADQKEKEKKERKGMEFWPLIKVVRLYTKSDCLSTGAVIVDLPGVHDSNAARAAVAAGYMKQCTGELLSFIIHGNADFLGLFIVAPINRAVDDKAAKSLLGESFKRQMKFDGTYSRITFICSKTDDISLIEATDSLGLQEKMAADWETVDDLEAKQRALKKEIEALRESKAVYTGIMDDTDDQMERWDQLKEDLEAGKTVYAPGTGSKKRKRSAKSETSRKKSKKQSKYGTSIIRGLIVVGSSHMLTMATAMITLKTMTKMKMMTVHPKLRAMLRLQQTNPSPSQKRTSILSWQLSKTTRKRPAKNVTQ
jgi:hypothetical protein